MSQNSLWFGYLEIADKSSPVVRDPKLITGKSDTVYLFNLNRNEFIEYKTEIVEPKLRDLNKDESDIAKELKKAYNKAIKEFTPRYKPQNIPETAPPKPSAKKKKKEEVLESVEVDDADDLFDDDIDDED